MESNVTVGDGAMKKNSNKEKIKGSRGHRMLLIVVLKILKQRE